MGETFQSLSPDMKPGRAEGRVALLWRGDPTAPPPDPARTRLAPIFQALESVGLRGVPFIYSDDVEARGRLLACDGVLAWVDPLSEAGDRSRLDSLLRDLAARGVWVSAHPDVILKMGTKEVLYRTRDLGWGADTDLYRTHEEFRVRFPVRLASSEPRVLKQYRGNGGQGVWKVEALADAAPGADTPVRVLHAQRGSLPEETTLAAFMDRCAGYFAGEGRLVDQAFQPRLPEGMIRCYLSGARVVGYGHQLIKALVPPPPEGPDSEAAQPGPRIMHPPEAPPFHALRRLMEADWVPALQARLDIDDADLPALWDADFLYGPKTEAGADTYVLCEINVSAVAPFPETAAGPVAEAALRGVRRRR